MAIFKAIRLSPSNSAIDGDVPNRFSWTTQGSAQTDYQVLIYKNSDNTLLHDSTKVTSSDEFYDLPSSTLTNGEECKWYVKTYSGVPSASSEYEFFKASSTPTVSFSDPTFVGATPLEITTQDYTFVLEYDQAEDISIKSYQLILYDSSGTVIVDDSEVIYGFNPQYEFTGMVNGTTYYIKGIVTSQDDLEEDTGLKEFYINYTLPEAPFAISAIADNDNGSIHVSWARLVRVLGIVTGSSTYIDPGKFNKGLQLNTGGQLTYGEDFEDTSYTFTYWFKLRLGKDGDFMTFNSGNMKVGYNASSLRFYYEDTGIKKYSDVITLYSWASFGTDTWNDHIGETWETISLTSTNYMDDYFFIGITPKYVIIKNNRQLIGIIQII